jgi:hypothetical protein
LHDFLFILFCAVAVILRRSLFLVVLQLVHISYCTCTICYSRFFRLCLCQRLGWLVLLSWFNFFLFFVHATYTAMKVFWMYLMWITVLAETIKYIGSTFIKTCRWLPLQTLCWKYWGLLTLSRNHAATMMHPHTSFMTGFTWIEVWLHWTLS